MHLQFLYFQLKESWSLDSDGKLEQGKFFKEKGTQYFKANKFRLALKMYKKAIEYLEFDSGEVYFYDYNHKNGLWLNGLWLS